MKTIKLADGREITYELTRKRVKNINFRAREDGIVAVSANSSVRVGQIEDFLRNRADFFFSAFERLKRRAEQEQQNSRLVKYLGREFPVRIIENSREIAVLDENECRVFTKNSDQSYVFSLIEKGIALPEDIDKALKFGPAFRYATTGQLEVADMGGLDIWATVGDNLLKVMDNSQKASPILWEKVKEGKLGIKTGEGFFSYPEEKIQDIKNEFNKRLITQLKASKKYI